MSCCEEYCPKYKAMQLIVVGAVVLANYWWNFVNWWLLVGALLVLAGVLKLIMPCCPCNKAACEAPAPKAARKKR